MPQRGTTARDDGLRPSLAKPDLLATSRLPQLPSASASILGAASGTVRQLHTTPRRRTVRAANLS